MVRALTFGETHIHGKNAQNPGKCVFDGLELPGPSPAWFQDYPRNSGFQGPGIAVPAGLGRVWVAVSRVSWNPWNSGLEGPGIAVPGTLGIAVSRVPG